MASQVRKWSSRSGETDRSLRIADTLNRMAETTGEEWRPVLGSRLYEVSARGRVRTSRAHPDPLRVLHPTIGPRGFLYVLLEGGDGRPRRYAVHKLGAVAFSGDPHIRVRHRNGQKTRNNMRNLARIDRRALLRRARTLSDYLPDLRHKLTPKDRQRIYVMFKKGVRKAELARCFELSWQHIHNVVEEEKRKELSAEFEVEKALDAAPPVQPAPEPAPQQAEPEEKPDRGHLQVVPENGALVRPPKPKARKYPGKYGPR